MAAHTILQSVPELPPPHDDIEYLQKRFAAYYYMPGRREVIEVYWNIRQHRAVFVDGNERRSMIDVDRTLRITLGEVLELKGVILYDVEMLDENGWLPHDTILNQPVEDMELTNASITSYHNVDNMSVPLTYHQMVPQRSCEPAG